MAVNYASLPVYEQKALILEKLANNQVIVVQSPTGSGKTTQIPIILHEAGYSENGIIAVTQPRRIAALSVSEFISKQLKCGSSNFVGYKMRFEDKTSTATKIKIMTDGILLQEMKFDPSLSKYSVIMVDEAHERSLNIDFVMGLLKRVVAERSDFKVIVSSATMNAEAFSAYFDNCPIVNIKTVTYPVTVVYDPPAIETSTLSPAATEALLAKIESTIGRVLDNRTQGAILCFLPGEKTIKDCMQRLASSSFARRLFMLPIYGRLSKEEQERVFDPAPFGKKKIILSTNIAETSVTIADVAIVIDSGLAKLNHYSPRTFTSSLVETQVSKASCDQRKGRAGRTGPGTCYRLYSRASYEMRPLYTMEEIYRTDLSEVVLRMVELCISNFETFDFISPPGHEGMVGAIDTLNRLRALTPERTLSETGKLMVEFPLMPRQSRMIVEAILKYPDVLEEVLIAAAFLSAKSPYILPPMQETDARKAHHAFRDMLGDFVSYLKLYRAFFQNSNRAKFCEQNFLDLQVMNEICNIKEQLEQIVARIGIPLVSGDEGQTAQGSRSPDDFLCCIASGMIQFVCVRDGRESYRSLTAEHIQIHPGSSMFRVDPLYFVAGEIVRTSRTFAMSVSPLTKALLERIDTSLVGSLETVRTQMRGRRMDGQSDRKTDRKTASKNGDRIKREKTVSVDVKEEERFLFGGKQFVFSKRKGKKYLELPLEIFSDALKSINAAPHTTGANSAAETEQARIARIQCMPTIQGLPLLSGERGDRVLKIAQILDMTPLENWDRNAHFSTADADSTEKLIEALRFVLRVTRAKKNGKELGFVCLFTDERGNYWFKVSRGFSTALSESLSSIEILIDESNHFSDEQKSSINDVYRTLNKLYS